MKEAGVRALRAAACGLALTLAAAAWGVSTSSAQTSVGMILPTSCGLDASAREEFSEQLAAVGLSGDKVKVYLQRPEDRKISRVQSVTKLLAHNVDIFVVYGSSAALDAAGETRSIPIVVLGAVDPVDSGLAKSISNPGKNITGVTSNPHISSLLNSIHQTASPESLGVLYSSENLESRRDLESIQTLASKLNLRVIAVDSVKTPPEELPVLLGSASFVLMTTGCSNPEDTLPSLVKLNTPVACRSPGRTGNGVVFVQAPNRTELLAEAAKITALIMEGRKPAKIPFRKSEKTDFIVDLKEAKRLGLSIPLSVLTQASSVSK